MKKLSILFLSVMATAFSVTSCSSNDDDTASIEGKWELSQEGIIVDGKEVLEPVVQEGDCPKGTMEFFKDGTFSTDDYEFYNSECNQTTETGTWSKNGNTLTSIYDYENEGTEESTSTSEILELTNSTLKIKSTRGEDSFFVTVFVRK